MKKGILKKGISLVPGLSGFFAQHLGCIAAPVLSATTGATLSQNLMNGIGLTLALGSPALIGLAFGTKRPHAIIRNTAIGGLAYITMALSCGHMNRHPDNQNAPSKATMLPPCHHRP